MRLNLGVTFAKLRPLELLWFAKLGNIFVESNGAFQDTADCILMNVMRVKTNMTNVVPCYAVTGEKTFSKLYYTYVRLLRFSPYKPRCISISSVWNRLVYYIRAISPLDLNIESWYGHLCLLFHQYILLNVCISLLLTAFDAL